MINRRICRQLTWLAVLAVAASPLTASAGDPPPPSRKQPTRVIKAYADEPPEPSPRPPSVVWVSFKGGFHSFARSGNLSVLKARPGRVPTSFGQGMQGIAPGLAIEYRPVRGVFEASEAYLGMALEATDYGGYVSYDDGAIFQVRTTAAMLSLRYTHQFGFGLQLLAGAGGGAYDVRRSWSLAQGGARRQSELVLGMHAVVGIGYRLTKWLSVVVEDRYAVVPGLSQSLVEEGTLVNTDEGGNVASISLAVAL